MNEPYTQQERETLEALGIDPDAPATTEQLAARDALLGRTPEDVPRGPWEWRAVAPASAENAPSQTHGEALVAADGSWICWSQSGHGSLSFANPAVKALLAKADVLDRLPELFELWDLFCDASAPVQQADCLLQFSNAFTHLRWHFTGELEEGR